MTLLNVKNELLANPKGTFLNHLPFSEHHFGACDIGGASPVWEVHPDTDEFFYILEGRFDMQLLYGPEPTLITADAGFAFVVPNGLNPLRQGGVGLFTLPRVSPCTQKQTIHVPKL